MNTGLSARMSALPQHRTGFKTTLADCADCMPDSTNTYDHLMDDSRSFLERVNFVVTEKPLASGAALATAISSTVGLGLVVFFAGRKSARKSPIADGSRHNAHARRSTKRAGTDKGKRKSKSKRSASS